MTMGMVEVSALAAWVGTGPPVTSTSTGKPTSSATRPDSRSISPSADRYSMSKFWLSTYPRSRSAWRNASNRGADTAGEPDPTRYPIRDAFGMGWDCAPHGSRPHPATSPSPPAPTTNARRLRRLPRRSIGGPSLGGIIPSRPAAVKARGNGAAPEDGSTIRWHDRGYPHGWDHRTRNRRG